MFECVRTYLVEEGFAKKTLISVCPTMFEIVEQEARQEPYNHPTIKNCVHDVWYTLPIRKIEITNKDDIEIATALSNYSISMDAAHNFFLEMYQRLSGTKITAKPRPREFYGAYEGEYLNLEIPYNAYHKTCDGVQLSEECSKDFSVTPLDMWFWDERMCLLTQIAKEEIPSPIAGKLLRKMLPKLLTKKC